MLNSIPNTINNLSRLTTLRHPNSMDCDVFRKTVNRVPDDATPGQMGGNATLGGLGVISSEDEANYDYAELGLQGTDEPQAKLVFVGIYQGQQSNWQDGGDTVIAAEPPIEALIECIHDPAKPEYFEPKKDDLVMLYPGAGIVVPYQVVGSTSPLNIPPYTRKWLLQPRNDLASGI